MIALLGASGRIGSEIDNALKILRPELVIKHGCHNNRVSREGLWESVDIEDCASLRNFLSDCDYVINAAGPSEKYSGLVLKQALELNIPLIDVGDGACYRELSDTLNTPTVLYGSGAVPGVIGIIPQVLAQEFKTVETLRTDYIINEPMTITAALDMSANMSVNNTQLDMVVNNSAVSHPFFGDSVYLYRYADKESGGIDSVLNVKKSSWFMARESDDLEKLLCRSYTDKTELAEAICRLSRMNMLGKESSIRMAFELSGTDCSDEKALTCFVQSTSPAKLSGCAAAAAFAVYEKKRREGVQRMALCSEWREIWNNLKKLSPFDAFSVYPCMLNDMEQEEGEL